MALCWLYAWVLLCVAAQEQDKVGGLTEASPADPRVKEAARLALEKYNMQSNDMFTYTMVKILSAQTQVVAGIIYYLELETVRCLKGEGHILSACPLRHGAMTYLCHFKFLEEPWETGNQLLKAKCGRPFHPSGGVTPAS